MITNNKYTWNDINIIGLPYIDSLDLWYPERTYIMMGLMAKISTSESMT